MPHGRSAAGRAGRVAGDRVIGPEGGLTEPERAALLSRPGYRPLRLAPHTLRFETAALVAAAVVTTARLRGPMADCLFCRIVAGEIPAKVAQATGRRVRDSGHRSQGARPRSRDPDPSTLPPCAMPRAPRARRCSGACSPSRPKSRRSWAGRRGLSDRDQHGTGCRPERGPSAPPRAGRAQDHLAAGMTWRASISLAHDRLNSPFCVHLRRSGAERGESKNARSHHPR